MKIKISFYFLFISLFFEKKFRSKSFPLFITKQEMSKLNSSSSILTIEKQENKKLFLFLFSFRKSYTFANLIHKNKICFENSCEKTISLFFEKNLLKYSSQNIFVYYINM